MAEQANQNISILVIDDGPAIGDALKLVLEASGYDVVLVDKGREGIRQSRKRRFTIIIIDFSLPDISGLEVFKTIRGHGGEAPVIMITAERKPEVFTEAANLGAIGVLSKPFSPPDILQLISKGLGR